MGLLGWLFDREHGAKLRGFAGIPGPRPEFPFGNLLEFAIGKEKPWRILQGYAERYGAMSVWWQFGTPMLVLGDADLVGDVLVHDTDSYYKAAPVAALEPLLTRYSSFVATDNRTWRPLDKQSILRAVASEELLGGQIGVMRKRLQAAVDGLVATGELDPIPKLRRIAFDVWSEMIVGRTFGDAEYAAVMKMAAFGNRRTTIPWPLFWPSASGRSFTESRSRWFGALQECIDVTRKQAGQGRTDLLSATLKSGLELSDEAIVAQLSQIYFAGMFSGGDAAVAAALYELTAQPKVAQDLVADLDELTRAGEYSLASLQGCARLDAVVRETLRLHAPVPIYFRNVVKDRPAKLGGREIPPDTTIMLSNWIIHRSNYWIEPDRFMPARWTPEVVAANPYGSAHFWPFGRGERACSGGEFALVYIKVALATILTRSRAEVGAGQPYDGNIFFAVVYPKGLKARFSSRNRTL